MWRPPPWSLAGIAGLALAAAFSCKTFDLPAETCDPSTLDAKRALESDDDCSRCLEDHCCDAVGVCASKGGDDAHPSCAKIVRQTQGCVLDAGVNGARQEDPCAIDSGLLTKDDAGKSANPEADGAYRCMRGSCGAQCGLPACKVDKAAVLIRNAQCDRCFAGGCCSALNSCYENRACKLMLECVFGECGGELGASLLDAGPSRPDRGPAGAPDDPERLCTLGGPLGAARIGAPQCVLNCLCRYRTNDEGLPPVDAGLAPFRLAEAVYQCGQKAKCGEDCSQPPDNVDAGDAGDGP